MGKGGLFVFIYSVILIALFITFSYLMMNVNPPRLKDLDGPSGNATGTDDLLYADEVLLPSDEFQYGLDKAPIRYSSIDINLTSYSSELADNKIYNVQESVNSNVRNVLPPLWPGKSSTLTTTVNKVPTFDKTKIPAKGFRRSINEENKNTQRQNVQRSLFLKIINDDGQPRIEIKLAPDDIVKKKTRKYRSSGTKLKPGIDNIMAKPNVASNHDYKRSVIKMEENKTLIFNFNDSSINLINESGISIVPLDEVQTKYFDDALNDVNNSNELPVPKKYSNPVRETTLNVEVFKLHLLDKNVSDTNIRNSGTEFSEIVSKYQKNTTVSSYTNSTERYKNVTKLSENSLETQAQITKAYETKNNIDQIDIAAISEPHEYKSTGHLIGLMIPEATATLPFNYHFIDGNDKNIFSDIIKSKRRPKRD